MAAADMVSASGSTARRRMQTRPPRERPDEAPTAPFRAGGFEPSRPLRAYPLSRLLQAVFSGPSRFRKGAIQMSSVVLHAVGAILDFTEDVDSTRVPERGG
jgi:hypothetical protein